jgi:AcrR family transcriptional regulator
MVKSAGVDAKEEGRVVKPRMKRDDRREQLLSVATEVLRQGGLPAVTMERVSEKANISKPVLYSHFPNRNALLLAMIREYWHATDAATVARSATAESFDDRLTAIVLGYFDVLSEKGSSLQTLILRNSHEPALEEARRVRDLRIEGLWAAEYESALGLSHEEAPVVAAIVRAAIAGAGEFYLLNKGSKVSLCIDACLGVTRNALYGMAGKPVPS